MESFTSTWALPARLRSRVARRSVPVLRIRFCSQRALLDGSSEHVGSIGCDDPVLHGQVCQAQSRTWRQILSLIATNSVKISLRICSPRPQVSNLLYSRHLNTNRAAPPRLARKVPYHSRDGANKPNSEICNERRVLLDRAPDRGCDHSDYRGHCDSEPAAGANRGQRILGSRLGS